MHVLITGGSGFVGRHLVTRLTAGGHQVRVLDRVLPPTEGAENLVEGVAGDFTDPDHVWPALDGVEAVYHLAVTTTPGMANERLLYDAQSNLLGTLSLIGAAVRQGVRRFIFASSGGSVYGPAARQSLSEDYPTMPISAHGVSKLAIEKYLHVFQHIHGLEYRVARGANPYGEGQDPSRGQGFIAYALGQMAQDQEIVIWGDGSVVRDFFYVGDFAAALALLLDDRGPHQVYNVGSGQGHSLLDVLTLLQQVTGHPARVRLAPGRPADVPYNCLDITRIREALGWTPQIDLPAGLARTWSWIALRGR